MQPLDYVVIALFFLLVAIIGWMAVRRIEGSSDYFVAGGRIPWWLGGISHHVSGHSGVVFVGYAAVAYQYGFTLYVWWAGSITVACILGAFVFAPRWARLQAVRNIESPTEYLALRYDRPTQQVMVAGVAAFVVVTYVVHASQGLRVLAPVATSLAVFSAMAWLNRGRPVKPEVDELLRRVTLDSTKPVK
jgi:Na+/proline symporter